MPNQRTIINASNIPLNTISGSIPQMGVTLADWFQNVTFGQVTKTTIGYQVQETLIEIHFWGLVMSDTGRDLDIRPSGERQWNNIIVYAQSAPAGAIMGLIPDDVIDFEGTRYRVMKKQNFALYGYVRFEMTENYIGDLPTP